MHVCTVFYIGVYNVYTDVAENLVLVETVLKTSEIQALLESTGLPVFFKGFGSLTSSEREGGKHCNLSRGICPPGFTVCVVYVRVHVFSK